MAKRILIAGFEPFGGDKVSPSEMVARSLEGAMLSGRTVAARVVPVETRNVRERFEQALIADDPDIVVLLSQFGGRTALSLERVSVNVLDFEYPDNVGVMRKGDVVSRGGAEARHFESSVRTHRRGVARQPAFRDTSRIRPERSLGIKRCTKCSR